MLLLEALKSNKGAILLLFHLLYLTRRWHLEIMNFNFCHRQRTKKKKKKNFIWELVLNILFLNATFKLLEKRSSAVISPNQYFFHCRSIMCRKRICHGGVRGARRDETYQSGTQTSLEKLLEAHGEPTHALISLTHSVTSGHDAAAAAAGPFNLLLNSAVANHVRLTSDLQKSFSLLWRKNRWRDVPRQPTGQTWAFLTNLCTYVDSWRVAFWLKVSSVK